MKISYRQVILTASILVVVSFSPFILHEISKTESNNDAAVQASNQIVPLSDSNSNHDHHITLTKLFRPMANTTTTSLKFISDILPFWLQNFSDIETNQDKTVTRYTIHYPQWSINTPRVLTTNTQLLQAFEQFLDEKGGTKSGDVSKWPESEGYIYVYHKPMIKVHATTARQNCGFKRYSKDHRSFSFDDTAPTGLEFINTNSVESKTDVETLIWISTPDDHIMQHMIDSTTPKWVQTVGLLYRFLNDPNHKQWINDGNWKVGLAWNQMLHDTGRFIVSHLWNQLGIDFKKHVFDYSSHSGTITAKHVIYGCYVPPIVKDSWTIVKKLFVTNPQTNLPYSIYQHGNHDHFENDYNQVSVSQHVVANDISDINEVSNTIINNAKQEKLKIMFLSRKKAKNGRVCVNEDQVTDAINKFLVERRLNDKFEVIMFNGTNKIQYDGYVEYLKHFAKVVVLLGTHGGAFYNVMFLNPYIHPTTIEVQMEYKMPYPFLPALSSMVQNYAYMVKTVDQNEWRIDVPKIIDILQTQLQLYA